MLPVGFSMANRWPAVRAVETGSPATAPLRLITTTRDVTLLSSTQIHTSTKKLDVSRDFEYPDVKISIFLLVFLKKSFPHDEANKYCE